MCFSRTAWPSPHCSSGCLLHTQSLPWGHLVSPNHWLSPSPWGRKGSGTASVVNMCSSSSGAPVPLTDAETSAPSTSGRPWSTTLWGMGPGLPTSWPEGLRHTTGNTPFKPNGVTLVNERQDTRSSWKTIPAFPSHDGLLWGTVVPKTCLQDNISQGEINVRSWEAKGSLITGYRVCVSCLPYVLTIAFWNCTSSQRPPIWVFSHTQEKNLSSLENSS